MSTIDDLARALEEFPGVKTAETDPGGDTERVNPGKRMDLGFGTWYIRFSIARTPEGWDSLEALTWIINNDLQLSGARFYLRPFAFSREDALDERLYFTIEGRRTDDIAWLIEHLQKGQSGYR